MYQGIFNHLMKRTTPFMKTQGITSRGHTFYKRHPQANIRIINFQRNKEGLPRVTINIGTYSLLLAAYSLVLEQHLSQQKNEEWRKYGDTTHHIEQLFTAINPLILYYRNLEIDEPISDEQLKIKWLSQLGTDRTCRLNYLCVLLKHSGKKEQLSTVLNEFGEFMQSHPEFIILKKSYGKFIQEASNRRDLSEEESPAVDNQPRKMNS